MARHEGRVKSAGDATKGRPAVILMQARLNMFGMNLYLIIGAVLGLAVLFVLLVTAWTGVSSLIWLAKRRRAERQFIASTRRADGQVYPAFGEGICGDCHRGDRKIYQVSNSDGLCPTCYERSWRHEARRPPRSRPNLRTATTQPS